MLNYFEYEHYENLKKTDEAAAEEYYAKKTGYDLGEGGVWLVVIIAFFCLIKYILITAAVGFSVFIIGKFIHECVKERKEKSLQNKSVEEITSHDNQE